MLTWIRKIICLIGTVSNGRREGANPSSHVTELPDLEFSNQFLQTSHIVLD